MREVEVHRDQWEDWCWEYERVGRAVPMFLIQGAMKTDQMWSLIQQNLRTLSQEFRSVNSQIQWFERLCHHLRVMEQLRDEVVVVS